MWVPFSSLLLLFLFLTLYSLYQDPSGGLYSVLCTALFLSELDTSLVHLSQSAVLQELGELLVLCCQGDALWSSTTLGSLWKQAVSQLLSFWVFLTLKSGTSHLAQRTAGRLGWWGGFYTTFKLPPLPLLEVAPFSTVTPDAESPLPERFGLWWSLLSFWQLLTLSPFFILFSCRGYYAIHPTFTLCSWASFYSTHSTFTCCCGESLYSSHISSAPSVSCTWPGA